MESNEHKGVPTMMLELYGMEETIRDRRDRIAHDVHAAQSVQAGLFRRLVGNALVHVGTAVRGNTEPKTVTETV